MPNVWKKKRKTKPFLSQLKGSVNKTLPPNGQRHFFPIHPSAQPGNLPILRDINPLCGW